MIGTDLDLELPSLSDSLAVTVAKIAQALSDIQDSLADRATPSAININSNLSFGGNQATNVGGVTLVTGNAPTAVGSFWYEGGSFYVKDATGVIKLTDTGTIDVTSTGAIGGDYGQGGNPATVVFDDSSGQYRFKEAPTIWADLVADDVLLMEGSGGTDYIRLSAPAGGVTTTYTVEFPAAPPGSQSLVQMESDGGLVASNTVPNAATFSAGLTASVVHLSVAQTLILPASDWRDPGAAHATGASVATCGASASPLYMAIPLQVGATITGVKVYVNKSTNGSNNVQAILWYVEPGVSASSRGSASNTANAPGQISLTFSNLTETLVLGRQYFVTFVNGGAIGDNVYHVEITYTV